MRSFAGGENKGKSAPSDTMAAPAYTLALATHRETHGEKAAPPNLCEYQVCAKVESIVALASRKTPIADEINKAAIADPTSTSGRFDPL